MGMNQKRITRKTLEFFKDEKDSSKWILETRNDLMAIGVEDDEIEIEILMFW